MTHVFMDVMAMAILAITGKRGVVDSLIAATSPIVMFAIPKESRMDELIGRAKKMKRLLEKADRCKCLDLENCGKVFLAKR